ncbi:MAG TPA: SDR family oxidoreductase [Acidimicrobiales bacterium]|nr:SDR family oxidoreductase [Acidimicrobiales bacterium]
MPRSDPSGRPTALITGASSGLGECFARALAARGSDVVLVARSQASLERLGLELEQAHGTRSEVLVADLRDKSDVDKVATRIREGGGVSTVINNAGFGTNGEFARLPVDGEVAEVQVNVLATVVLSHAALEVMVPRGSGGLLNVASVGGFTPAPTWATYGATKAFVLSFTEALHIEAAPHGVHVSVLAPGFTRTRFQERAGMKGSGPPAMLWSEPEPVVDAALAALDKNQAVCVPGGLNKAAVVATRLVPKPLFRVVASQAARRL